MKVNDSEAHITMGNGEVSAGDPVLLLRNECKNPPLIASGVKSTTCQKVMIGGGKVIKIPNDDYSIIKVDGGVNFGEGTIGRTVFIFFRNIEC
ncbi:MAG: hypothetical protein A4S09_11215 [Proteobacteria bacterium SG_bin7]|nr:MAG: hypothetical protein A4S09_11215 [Proteobacteria bacterium SG_bin7]